MENLSITEAKRLIEKTKDKLHLLITKKKSDPGRHKRQNSQLKEDPGEQSYLFISHCYIHIKQTNVGTEDIKLTLMISECSIYLRKAL